ncbi:MAG: hypothetical protein WBO66_02080 [Candidatus Moraniibacteriota bacterium]
MILIFGGVSPTSFAGGESAFQWSGSADVRSKYVGGMTGTRIVDGSVIQPSMTLSHENCYANVWASFHMADPSHIRKGDEVDLSGGCTWAWGVVTHTVSLLYYDLYPLRSCAWRLVRSARYDDISEGSWFRADTGSGNGCPAG